MNPKKVNALDPFVPVGFVMIRAPILPIEGLYSWAGTNDRLAEGDDERLRAATEKWVREQLAEPYVQEALLAGSPDLVAAIKRYKNDPDSRKGRRAQANLFRYLLRMTTRPTPFGLFAGVALAELGTDMDIRIGPIARHRKRCRPDMQWCMAIVKQLEQREAVIPHLDFFPNPTLQQAGGRLYVPVTEAYGQEETPSNASLRATPIVLQVLEAARNGKSFAGMERLIREARPEVPHHKIHALIKELCSIGVLMSDLRPPLTGTDAVRYMESKIKDVPDCEDIRVVLQDAISLMGEYKTQPLGGGIDTLERFLDVTGGFSTSSRSNLEVDLALSLERNTFSASVAQEIAHAATLLLRLSASPVHYQHLDAYRQDFIERYGEGREIPLLELLDEEIGLGPPSTYQHPASMRKPTPFAGPSHSARDQALMALAVAAIHDGQREVELDDDHIQQIELLPDKWQDVLPDSLDLYVSLLAPSQAAVNADDYRIVIGPRLGDDPAGRSFGRFHDILDHTLVERLRDLVRSEQASYPDAIIAELVYLPNRGHAANVAVCPSVRDYEIAVDVSPSVPFEKLISPSDLVVGIREGRFYVRSSILEKDIIARSMHLLNWMHASNVCRFLMEIGREGTVHLGDITWSNGTTLPFVPRLRIGRVILRAAEWCLAPGLLGGTSRSYTEQLHVLQQWREGWNVPRYVYLAESDNRLLLDLENPLCVRELIDACNQRVENRIPVRLQELLPDFSDTWLSGEGGHFVSEFIVPLARRQDGAVRTSALRQSPKPVSRSAYQRMPGSDWLYVKLYSGRTRHDELLSGPIRQFVEQVTAAGMIDRWFFIRYADPFPHLRLRFHGDPSALLKEVVPALMPWTQTLADAGLVQRLTVDTYSREVERYGGPQGMDVAERLFAVDSAFVTDTLLLRGQNLLTMDATDLALLTMDDLLISIGRSVSDRLATYGTVRRSQEARFGWDIEVLRKSFHQYRKVAQRILCDRTWLQEQPGGSELEILLQRRSEALFTIADQVQTLSDSDGGSASQAALLGSYIHMHYNRLLGINRQHEFSTTYFLERTLDSIARFSLPNILPPPRWPPR